MSLLDSFTKKKTLNAAISQTAKARNSEGKAADQLYQGAYHDYAEVLVGEPLRSEALYNWGFALLHQAKTKTGDEAIKLYQEAIAKFYFCLLLNPSYLGSSINVGVAFMDLARIQAVDCYDEIYEIAKDYFDKANAIQAGSASYNLACVYGLRNEGDACLHALENAKSSGSLPDVDDIINDPDLDNIKNLPWFIEFMATLSEKSEAVNAESTEVGSQTAEQEVEKAEPAQQTVVDSAISQE